LFTRRVRRMRWKRCVHLLLFRRFGPGMQHPTAGFRLIDVSDRQTLSRETVVKRAQIVILLLPCCGSRRPQRGQFARRIYYDFDFVNIAMIHGSRMPIAVYSA
jgi:hypothetical protein